MLRALLLLKASPDATETMLAGGFLRTLLGEVLFAQMRFR